jgi:hypothetical protein
VKLLLIPIAVAVIITALTPLGSAIGELLFPTKAVVSGAVTMAGKPISGATVKLSGRDVGSTDAAGMFLIPDVDDGSYVIEVRAAGAHTGQQPVTVARSATEVKAGPVELQPLVELGLAVTSLDLQPSRRATSFVLDYDFTLWIVGDTETMSSIVGVNYALPTPLTTAPATGGSRESGFCYRQSGTVSFDMALGSPGLDAASAAVTMDDGQSFTITAQAGKRLPPPCPETKGGTRSVPAGQAPSPGVPGGAPPPPPPPALPTPPTPPTTEPTTEPPQSGPRLLSFAVKVDCSTPDGGTVTFTYATADATSYEISVAGDVRSRGALSKAPTTQTLSISCAGTPQEFSMTVFDDDGRRSETLRATAA